MIKKITALILSLSLSLCSTAAFSFEDNKDIKEDTLYENMMKQKKSTIIELEDLSIKELIKLRDKALDENLSMSSYDMSYRKEGILDPNWDFGLVAFLNNNYGELTEKENIKAADTVKRITATAVMAALTTLMTAYIFHIPVGVNGGYVHLGDTMIYLAAAFLPLPYACAAGAIGGGLADLLTAPVWAPATIIIKMLICLPFSSKGTKLVTKRNVVALFLAFAISATGYYIAEGIMFGFTASFFTSVSGSIVQSGGSAIMFVIIGTALDKIGFKTNIAK